MTSRNHVANGRVDKEQRQMVASDTKNGREVWASDYAHQIKVLDDRLGAGKGAKKERTRLEKLISGNTKTKAKK